MREELYKLGYYILGDFTYAVELFFLPPYEGANSQSSEDNFNFINLVP